MSEVSSGQPLTIRHILSPTDLSEASAPATQLAVALAGWYGAHVTGLFVLNPLVFAFPEPASIIAASIGESSQDLKTDESALAHLRQEVSNRFAGAEAARVTLDVLVEVGQPVTQILACASRLPADLIVVGTHGAGGFEHLIVGSVAEQVLRRASCPVLTVPPRAHVSSPMLVRRVLCAVDKSDSARAALASACSLAQHSTAALTLVHVLEWPWEEPPAPKFDELPAAQAVALSEYRRYREHTASQWLDSLVPTPIAASTRLSSRVVHGRPYRGILEVAAHEDSDLIVMGVGDGRVADRALFGSTANQVVRGAACPVLTVRR